jgi:small-conductance mechanosensitive channel
MSRRTTPIGIRLAALVAFVAFAAFAAFAGLGARVARAAPTPEAADTADEPPAKDALDRETPRRTMDGFLRETRNGNFRVAASYLDLMGIPAASRDEQGPDLAQKLGFVLERQPTLHLDKIPDVAEGDPAAKPAGTFVADTLYAGEEPVPITLKRAHFSDGVDRWLIAPATVALIPVADAAYGPRPIGVSLPPSLTRPMFLGNELWQWLGLVLATLIAYLVARIGAAIVVRTTGYFFRTTPRVDNALVESARRPLRAILWAIIFRLWLGPLQLTTAVVEVCDHVIYTALVLGITWLILRGLGASTMLLEQRVARESYDAFQGRRMRTQAVLLRRVAGIVLGFIAGAVVLLQFELVRSVGVSLLASAGVLGVVVGVAAQRSLAAVVGGIQFSVAQPVRMSDQVVVEGEFGEIEEINLTYVVLRLWDKRRLIVPITYFLEKPFQNWTRTATDLVGAVNIKVDFAMPVDAIRAELRRICEADPLWDKKTCAVQATDSDAASVTLRALVSAADAPRLWELRCRVRENLLAFVQAHVSARSAAPAPRASA